MITVNTVIAYSTFTGDGMSLFFIGGAIAVLILGVVLIVKIWEGFKKDD